MEALFVFNPERGRLGRILSGTAPPRITRPRRDNVFPGRLLFDKLTVPYATPVDQQEHDKCNVLQRFFTQKGRF